MLPLDSCFGMMLCKIPLSLYVNTTLQNAYNATHKLLLAEKQLCTTSQMQECYLMRIEENLLSVGHLESLLTELAA